jgi:hypothetical protein
MMPCLIHLEQLWMNGQTKDMYAKVGARVIANVVAKKE